MTDSTAELLQKHFDLALEAPDGITKLRELILTLAMQGKLVPQDPNDPPARTILSQSISRHSKKAIEPARNGKDLASVGESEERYQIPGSWIWTTLGDISAYIQRGKGPSYSETPQVPVISQKCVQWSGFNPGVVRFIDPASLPNYGAERFVRNGDILWNSTGTGTIGRVAVYRDELSEYPRVVADSHVTIVRTSVCNPDFILSFLKSPMVQSKIESMASGTTNQIELNTSTVIEQRIPLPPLPEQRRIVAKIDQLMAVCDDLEKKRDALMQKRLAVHNAAIRRLLEADESSEFSSAWDFLMEHFGEVYSIKENVAELRKAILQLAVMGKLVKQDPNDPPASELLKEIEAEKRRLIKEGKIKAPRPLLPITAEEVPFPVPSGWEWVRLGILAELLNGDRGKNYPNREEYVESGIPWINTGHIEPDGSLSKTEMHYITRQKFDSLNGGKIQPGDLVYCLRGATLGKTAFVQPLAEGAIASSLVIVRPFEPNTRFYFYRYLTGPIGRSQIFRFDNGSAQPNLSAASVQLYYFPLPPLPEQHRIVAKVDQLMALCDTLEHQIDASTNQKSAILNAVLAQV